MIARLVTLLPDPDSPTMPSVSPRRTLNERSVTAWTTPSRVRKRTVRFRTSRSVDRSSLRGRASAAQTRLKHTHT